MVDMQSTAIVFIGHGSRRRESNLRFEKLVAKCRSFYSKYLVLHGYIELAQPQMEEALSQAARQEKVEKVIVVPVLLFRAGHAKTDIPLSIHQMTSRYPQVSFLLADVIGVHPNLAKLAYLRLMKTELSQKANPSQTALLYVGRGSNDPDANSEFFKQARLFSEGRDFAHLIPCFIGISSPSLDEGFKVAARLNISNILVVPHLLFSGILTEKIERKIQEFQKTHSWIRVQAGAPLGDHEFFLEVLHQRIQEVESGKGGMPCDTCRFRIPFPGQESQVNGLKALLWSIRHSLTHNQAAPREHSHSPLQRHILICTNADCASRGSIRTLQTLRKLLKEKGLSKGIAVTQTSCMGRCSDGPTVVVYPDGIWYHSLTDKDAEELIESHIVQGQLLSHRVDNIMQ